MQFEHVVVVNDPREALVAPLSRAQVWAGLMWRVEDPCVFQPSLVGCEIITRSNTRVERALDFGSFRMRDTVHLLDQQALRFESEADGARAAAQLTISIEIPIEGALVLRFAYATTFDESAGAADAEYAGYIKSAYRAADIDTVRLIREHAMRGNAH